MRTPSLLQPLLDSPQLVEHVVELQRVVETERERRLKAGRIVSPVIAGFAMPIRAAFDDDANVAVLRQWLA